MQKILLTLTCLLMAGISVMAQSDANTITIIDATKFTDPAVNWKNANDRATYNAGVAEHKDHYVAVYRKNGPMSGIGYTVSYYQNENDTIKNHQFMAMSNEVYDKAQYTWSKDTVCVRLYSSDTKKGETFKGYGWGNSSTLVR